MEFDSKPLNCPKCALYFPPLDMVQYNIFNINKHIHKCNGPIHAVEGSKNCTIQNIFSKLKKNKHIF